MFIVQLIEISDGQRHVFKGRLHTPSKKGRLCTLGLSNNHVTTSKTLNRMWGVTHPPNEGKVAQIAYQGQTL
jgi:steroid 5-alpha reductase family enzyme